MVWILLSILFSAITVAGDYFIKRAGEGKGFALWQFFIPGWLIYTALTFGWLVAMKHLKLSTIAVIYGVSTALFLTLLSVLVFHERLSWAEALGVGLAITSMVLLARFYA